MISAQMFGRNLNENSGLLDPNINMMHFRE